MRNYYGRDYKALDTNIYSIKVGQISLFVSDIPLTLYTWQTALFGRKCCHITICSGYDSSAMIITTCSIPSMKPMVCGDFSKFKQKYSPYNKDTERSTSTKVCFTWARFSAFPSKWKYGSVVQLISPCPKHKIMFHSFPNPTFCDDSSSF